ncbi:MAG: hypothetical protein ACYTGH_12985 [Planctomycetota bacterium]|jgi:hypothetical protein
MMINHVHDALRQVRTLQQRVMESKRFRGYSGRARGISGIVALIGALLLSSLDLPAGNLPHFLGWGAVFLFAVSVNYGALILWYRERPPEERDRRELLPLIDNLAPLTVGGILSLSMVLRGDFDSLFGIWMCLFGLANMSARMVLPPAVWWVGLFYIAAGAACLLHPASTFTNPWPMGITFCIGELMGGYIFFANQNPEYGWAEFLLPARLRGRRGQS